MQPADHILISEYKSPYGELIIGTYNEKLCMCDWKYRKARTMIDGRIQTKLAADFKTGECDTTRETISQLEAYFAGERKSFSLPLLPQGTAFQLSVWRALLEIPYGETISYLALARRLGDRHAVRSVASANGANAISIIIPCHRVIGSKGELTGYAGGLPVKKALLRLESGLALNGQLELF